MTPEDLRPSTSESTKDKLAAQAVAASALLRQREAERAAQRSSKVANKVPALERRVAELELGLSLALARLEQVDAADDYDDPRPDVGDDVKRLRKLLRGRP